VFFSLVLGQERCVQRPSVHLGVNSSEERGQKKYGLLVILTLFNDSIPAGLRSQGPFFLRKPRRTAKRQVMCHATFTPTNGNRAVARGSGAGVLFFHGAGLVGGLFSILLVQTKGVVMGISRFPHSLFMCVG